MSSISKYWIHAFRRNRNGVPDFWQRDFFEEVRKSEILEFLYDILDKQFRAYSRNDQKCSAIITIDVAMLSGILLLVGSFSKAGTAVLVGAGIAFAFLVSSFVICLVHSLPRSEAHVGNANDNPRVLAYISKQSRDSYYGLIQGLDIDGLVRMTSYQVLGMSYNIRRGQRILRWGVAMALVGVVVLAGVVPVAVFQNL